MTQQQMKRHARTLPDSGRLLWVGDDQDWALMRSANGPSLACPQPGCGERLHGVCNRHGTRFLRRATGSGGGCPHWWVTGGRTGPESARHLWLKARLASICLHLGWAAVPEDPVTKADVWLPDAATALEVQLRRTDALARTRARFQAGATSVVWFLAADVAAGRTLFRTPAVRFDVVAATDAARSVTPWLAPMPGARLVVFGPIWRWQDWRLVTGRMSGYVFLAELLAGQLGWCPPGTPGLPPGRGGWIRWRDLALALGMPGCPLEEVRAGLPLTQSAWIDAEWGNRRIRGGAMEKSSAADRGRDGDSLLEPVRDPESWQESDAYRQEWERRRLQEDRPPHHEDR